MDNFELTKENIGHLNDYMQRKGLSYRTIKVYNSQLDVFKRKFGKINQDISNKILKKNNLTYKRAVLSLINDYCLFSDIDFRLKFVSTRKKDRKLPDILQISEIKKLIKASPKPYDLMLRCIWGIGAGLRVSEVLKLSYQHFRWVEWFESGKKDGIVVIKETKRNRNIVLNVPENIMKAIYQRAKEDSILNEWNMPNQGVLFDFGISSWNPDMKNYNLIKWKEEYLSHAYNQFRYLIMQKTAKKVLGRQIKIHSLRHSRASYLLSCENIPIQQISKLLGHKSINTTMIYIHLDPRGTLNLMKGKKGL